MILGYIVRHGYTDMSPQPEWQSQIPLNALGEAQAHTAGEWLKFKIPKKKLPVWGVSSDLKRAEQTLEIVSKSLNLEIVKPMAELRALDYKEDPKEFEARNKKAFIAIFATAKTSGRIALVACHRSNTAWLATQFGGVKQEMEYRELSAVHEGGILEVSTERGLFPLYKTTHENPREDMLPMDGTGISGFVDGTVNEEPRRCGNCKWIEDGHCDNPMVTADDELGMFYGRKRNAAGKWKVEPGDCCNGYQHKFVDKYKGGA